MKKRRFFQADLNLLLAFLLPAAVFLLCLGQAQIVPFGECTLLISDMDTQYAEFLSDYQRVLKGDGGFFYSWTAGMGMNYPGLVAYYLSSPFNLLLVFFPDNEIPLAVSLLTTLKLACCGLAFAFYLKKRFGKSNPFLSLFAMFYALSAYAVGYAFNIMWLDSLILLPLLCWGIERLLRSGKWIGLSLLWGLTFLANFYTAWMCGVYGVLYLGLRLICLWRDPALFQTESVASPVRKTLLCVVRFGLAVCLGAGLSAFLLLPAWLVLKNNMGLIGQSAPKAEGQFFFPDLLSKFFVGTFDGMKDCLPHVYCGLAGFAFALLYFCSRQIRRREKLCSLSLILFLMFSFWFKPLDFFWHALDYPSWFPYRYAFLLIFSLLSCAWEAFLRFEREDLFPLLIILTLMLGSGLFFSLRDGERFPLNVLGLNGLFLVSWALVFLRGYPWTQWSGLALIAFGAMELFINGSLIFDTYAEKYTLKADYDSFVGDYRARLEGIRPGRETFYRIEKDRFRTYNDPMGIGFPGISHFSSTASSRQSMFLKRLGFDCYATWCTYDGSTAFSDALLDIRYVMTDQGKPGYRPVKEGVWENPNSFPLFFFAEERFARVDYLSDQNPVERQNLLLQALAESDDPFFTPLPVELKAVSNLNVPAGHSDCFARMDAEQPAAADFEIHLTEDAPHSLYISEFSGNYNVYLNDRQVYDARRDVSPFLISLDAYALEGKVRVHVDLAQSTDFCGGVKAYVFDSARFADLAAAIRGKAPEIIRDGNSRFTLNLDPDEESRLLFSSIAFDSGWRVRTGDGKKLTTRAIHEGLLGVDVPAGTTQLIVDYLPGGWREGSLISLLSLFALSGTAILFRNRRVGYN